MGARGTNPGDAIRALSLRRPTSARDAEKVANEWLASVRRILNGVNASGTGATHTSAIVQNELAELANDEATLKAAFADFAKTKAGMADYKTAIDSVTSRRAAEVALEFRHNVILKPGQRHTVTKQGGTEVATPAGLNEWSKGDITMLEKSLEGIPADATRGNPHAVTFLRGDFEVGAGGAPDRRMGGITSGTAPEITMFDRGMTGSQWGEVEAPNVRQPAHVHTPRHELGHVVQQRLTNAEKEQLFTTIMRWEMYPLAFLANEAGDPQTPKARARLRQETGLNDAAVGRFIDSVQPPPASQFHGPRRAHGSRTYFKSSGLLHSVGNPAELPTGIEFDYCFDNQGEYVAELYAFAIARPAWLASKLSQRQIKWFKEVVFRVPVDPAALRQQMNPPAPVAAQFLSDAATLFTWEQLDLRLAELIKAQQTAPTNSPAPVP